MADIPKELSGTTRLLQFIDACKDFNTNRAIGSARIVGGWVPIWGDNPDKMLTLLHQSLSAIRKQLPASPQTFLDLGGAGDISALAQLAGFEETHAIELQEPVFEAFGTFLEKIGQRGIIDPKKINRVHGSYYSQAETQTGIHSIGADPEIIGLKSDAEIFELFDILVLPLSGSLMLYDTVLSRPEQEKMIQQQIDYLNQHALSETSPILDAEGHFKAEAVYVWPSDIFFTSHFIPMLEKRLKPGAFFVSPTTNSQMAEVIKKGQLTDFKALPFKKELGYLLIDSPKDAVYPHELVPFMYSQEGLSLGVWQKI